MVPWPGYTFKHWAIMLLEISRNKLQLPHLKQLRHAISFVHCTATWLGNRHLAQFCSNLLASMSGWYNSAENTPIWRPFSSGDLGTVMNTNRLPVSQFVSLPFLSRTNSALMRKRSSKFLFIRAFAISRLSTLMGMLEIQRFVEGFSSPLSSRRLNGFFFFFLSKKDTRTPHTFISWSSDLSLAAFVCG